MSIVQSGLFSSNTTSISSGTSTRSSSASSISCRCWSRFHCRNLTCNADIFPASAAVYCNRRITNCILSQKGLKLSTADFQSSLSYQISTSQKRTPPDLSRRFNFSSRLMLLGDNFTFFMRSRHSLTFIPKIRCQPYALKSPLPFDHLSLEWGGNPVKGLRRGSNLLTNGTQVLSYPLLYIIFMIKLTHNSVATIRRLVTR